MRAVRWIAPPLDGPATGGTLYNRGLLASLRARGIEAECIRLSDAAGELAANGRVADYWLDTLYLERAPELAVHGPVGMMVHYLPSLAVGQPPTAGERAALAACRAALAPSSTMAAELRRIQPALPVAVVEPGLTHRARSELPAAGALHGVVVANLHPGKGVLELLQALGRLAAPDDTWTLQLLGAPVDAAYALRCAQLADGHAELTKRVRLAGPVPPQGVVTTLQRAHALLSPSRFESYGMAIAEARAAGLLLLVRRGGHAAQHVDDQAGGAVFRDAAELAADFVGLARDPVQRADRIARARSQVWTRSWSEAADDFIRRCGRTSTASA